MFVVIKIALFLCLSVVVFSGRPPGFGIREVDVKKAEVLLNRSLTKLAAGDGPYYSIGKIYSATELVVEGLLSQMVADLVDKDGKTKKCNISIWSREWLPNGIEISFECPNEPKLTKTHSPEKREKNI